MTFFAVALLLVSTLAAQKKEDRPKDPLRALADAAMAAPPELAADLLIRIAESGKVTDRTVKVEWLERAFALAPSARFRLPRSGSFGRALSTDSDAGATTAALRNGLDTLSLQSRIVRAMLPLDRAKAMDLFRSIPPLQIPALTCKDATVYSVAAYYGMIRAVFQQGFTAQERKDEKDVELLRTVLGRIRSPFELMAASMLVELKLDGDVFSRLLGTYGGALREMRADDRSFSTVTNVPVFLDYGFLEARRLYLVRHLSGVRCADSIEAESRAKGADQSETFNALARRYALTSGVEIPPITAEERKPAKVEGTMDLFLYWETPRTRKLLMDLKKLRFGTDEQQAENDKKPPREDGRHQFLTEQQRSDPAWEALVRDYLKDLERWSKDHDETEANYFHMASETYGTLIELIPAHDLRGEILRSYIAFLRQSPLERDNPAEWYLEANRLINFHGTSQAERAWIRDEIKASGDLVMSLYIDLDTLAPPVTTSR